ncbi:hypothetical protein DSO57_1009964 [Entomophthora muscae]|uniref:Uncharacterized protein n=1 Tax=Entomophthora muscae TaxID=34485 RepID=A0ACC2UGF1_9FUNG|nr:hypothetical protein DSO57_1009964 [Entomophthora muscae]
MNPDIEGQEQPTQNKYLLHSNAPVPRNIQKRFKATLNFKTSQTQHHENTGVDSLGKPEASRPKKKEKCTFIHGNFANYYTYRNQGLDHDPRLDMLDKELFFDKHVLDIGCNSGFITTHIALHFEPKNILGIDLDPVLIEKAWSHLKFEASLLAPNSDSKQVHFPISMPLLFGGIPLHGPPGFPSNASFECVDITTKEACADLLGQIDTVLVLSITKWIHLNGGDEAIKRFFRLIGRILAPGGKLVLEPQPWDSYSRRSSVSDTTAHHYPKIKFRPEKFEKFLVENVGLKLLLGTSTPSANVKSGRLLNGTGFKRPIFIYQKPLSLPSDK